jgi:hypothetical protein
VHDHLLVAGVAVVVDGRIPFLDDRSLTAVGYLFAVMKLDTGEFLFQIDRHVGVFELAIAD